MDSREAKTTADRPGKGRFQQPGGDHEWGYRRSTGNGASSYVGDIVPMEKTRIVHRLEVEVDNIRDQR